MPLLDVCLEAEAHEQAAATADQNAYRCDLCRRQTGTSWLGHLWLCALCRALEVMVAEAEREG